MIHPPQTLKLLAIDATAIFPLGGRATRASVTATAQGSAWGTAVLTPKWSNDEAGPFFAFNTADLPTGETTMGPADDSIYSINVTGKGFLVIVVTTAEGADETVNIRVCDDRETVGR